MAYSKTVWKNDMIPDIDASNLNHMEQGIYDNDYRIENNCFSVNIGNGSATTLSNLNDAPENKAIGFFIPASTTNWPTNWPDGAKVGGRPQLITHANKLQDGSTGYKFQVLIHENGIYKRSYVGSWNTWKKCAVNDADVITAITSNLSAFLDFNNGKLLQSYTAEITNNVTTLADLDNAEENTAYWLYYTSSYANRPSHYPSGASGLLILLTIKVGSSKVQFAFGIDGMRMRYYSGNMWTYWRQISISASYLDKVYRPIITIAADGSGDYTKFKDGIEAAMAVENATVYVRAGTYDLLDEWGGSEWAENYTYESVGGGLAVGKNVHIICDSKALITFYYSGTNADLIENFSPLNSGNLGSFTIENMRLRATNCRYAFHDEVGGADRPQQHKFLNCDFYLDNSENSVWNNKPCIGGGLGKDEEVIIDGCRFEAITDGRNIAGASYHNTGNADARSVILIKDSWCANHNTFMGTARGNSQLISEFVVTGCSVYTEPYVGYDSQSQPYENMVLKAWNNEVRSE